MVGVRAPRPVPVGARRRRGVPDRAAPRAHRAARRRVAARPPRPRDRRCPPAPVRPVLQAIPRDRSLARSDRARPTTAAGRQQAVLATRRGKPEVEGERFDAAWKAEALAAGGDPTPPKRSSPASPRQRRRPRGAWRLPEEDPEAASRRGPRSHRRAASMGASSLAAMTVQDSTFTRPELVQAVAAGWATGRRWRRSSGSSPVRWRHRDWSRSPATFDDQMGRRLAARSRAPVPRSSRPAHPACHWPSAHRDGDRARPHSATTRPKRSEHCGSTDAVTVLVGPAGTGKTFTLDTVRAVFEAAGYRVIGAAPSARAATRARNGAGVDSSTLHRLAGEWSRGYDRPDARTVLVVDEAAMAGIRDLERSSPRPSTRAVGWCSPATTASSPRSPPAAGSPPRRRGDAHVAD